jgi:O-antigen ligase
MIAALRTLRFPTSQSGLGLAVGLGAGLLYLLYQTWGRAGVLFMGAGGVVAVLIALRNPLAALLMFALTMTSAAYVLVPILSPRLLIYICIAAIVFTKLAAAEYTWRVTPVLVAAMLFTVYTYTAVIWADDLTPFTTHFFVTSLTALLSMFAASELIRSPREWRWLMIALGLGIIFSTASAVLGVFTFVAKDISTVDPDSVRKISEARFYGHWGVANGIAHTLAPFTALFVPYLHRSEATAMRIFSVVTLFSGILAIAMSLSRAGLLALAITLVVVFVVSRYRKALFLAACMAVVVSTVLLPVNLIGRVEGLSSGRSDASINERSFIARGAWNTALDYAPFGAGFGGFGFHYQDYLQRSVFVAHSHNAYLHILAETGIPGILLYLAVYGAALWAVFGRPRGVNRDSVAGELRIALGAAVVATSVAVLFEHNFGWLPHWLLFALVGIYPHVFGEAAQPQA